MVTLVPFMNGIMNSLCVGIMNVLE